MSAQDRKNAQPGVIEAAAAYTLPEFQSITQLGDAAMRQARRKGLAVTKVGRRSFVYGQDFIDYMRSSSGNRSQVTND